jgi:U3 small nucleolar RNA-associated protein 18
VDEDDTKVAVSLAGSTRLRKLRHDEDDDVVDGVEYQKRLQTR